jgi:hypothetical protein
MGENEKNIVEDWKARANAKGKTLAEVCRDAGVNRKTIEHWKKILPQPVRYFLNMEKQLAELEK